MTFFQCWGLNTGHAPWASLSAFFLWWIFFKIRSSKLFARAGFKPWSSSVRIIGVSHQHPAQSWLFEESRAIFLSNILHSGFVFLLSFDVVPLPLIFPVNWRLGLRNLAEFRISIWLHHIRRPVIWVS
jgi:hypothetical protein